MLETILAGLGGGILRLIPEAFKIFDRANERKHELAMQDKQLEFAKLQGNQKIAAIEGDVTIAQFDAIAEAVKEQSQTATAAGKIIAAISALVRPLVTYIIFGMYVAVKVASFFLALDQGAEWRTVLVSLWTVDDIAVLNAILTFWFVGRIYERKGA